MTYYRLINNSYLGKAASVERINGVPARLAAARVQRVTEIETTNIVNQVITSGN